MSFALTKLDEKCEKASVDRLRDRDYIEMEIALEYLLASVCRLCIPYCVYRCNQLFPFY